MRTLSSHSRPFGPGNGSSSAGRRSGSPVRWAHLASPRGVSITPCGMSSGISSGSSRVAAGDALGDGEVADDELFTWWSQMIELPVVAEGGLTEDRMRALAPITDFFALGEEIWSQEDALSALNRLTSAMR